MPLRGVIEKLVEWVEPFDNPRGKQEHPGDQRDAYRSSAQGQGACAKDLRHGQAAHFVRRNGQLKQARRRQGHRAQRQAEHRDQK